MNPTLYVKQHDWPLRWLVESESTPEFPHLVDLGEYKGNGACGCLHFRCLLEPLIKAGAIPGNDTRCKHIKAARGMFCDVIIRQHSTRT